MFLFIEFLFNSCYDTLRKEGDLLTMRETNTASRLNSLMKERNLRQVDILRKCKPFCEKYNVKLGRNDLSQYVNGKSEPRQEKLSILGLALNVDEAWLMGYDVPKERNKITITDHKEINDEIIDSIQILAHKSDYNLSLFANQYQIVYNNCIVKLSPKELSSLVENSIDQICFVFKSIINDKLHDSTTAISNLKNSAYPDTEMILSYNEQEYIKKYRFISEHSLEGTQAVDAVLDKEYSIAHQLKEQREYIIELENLSLEEHKRNTQTRLINYYYRLASAGTGQIIFDTPPTKRIEIPDIPEYKNVDYAIGVNGSSMEPTYRDNDTLLVEMTDEVEKGEIGIFSVNNDCYVKKRGDKELISLNHDFPNIPLNESAICMGKVIDKLNSTE